MQKRVLVTGSAGFLGREVFRQLKLRDDVEQIIAIDNMEPLCGGDPSSGAQFADVTDLKIANPDITHIIHLAAIGRNLTCEKDPYRAFQINVNGTLAILELAHKLGAEALICSSNIVLSDQNTVYRMTKRTAEQLTCLYADHGTKAMVLRPSNIAGPGQSRTEYQPCAFAMMDKCFEEKGYIELTGTGEQRRDFVNVKDVARAFVMALDHMVPGATLDICTGKLVTINWVVTQLGVHFQYVPARPGDAKVLISDPRPAANVLGFQAEIPILQTVNESFPAVVNATTRHTSQQL